MAAAGRRALSEHEAMFLGAAQVGRLDIVESLWRSGNVPDVDCHDGTARTPLMFAVWNQHIDVARFLLEVGRASTASRTDESLTPLHLAAVTRQVEMIELLCRFGADTEARCELSLTPLLIAAKTGHLEIVKRLLDRHADINCESAEGATPLTIAMQYGHSAVCRLLLKRGAATESRTSDSWTPLHRAAYEGNVAMIDMLYEFKADVNAQGPHGNTALHMALEGKSAVAMQRLLYRGASADAVDDTGCTVLLQACSLGDRDFVDCFLQTLDDIGALETKLAVVNKARPKDGKAPLHITVQSGHTEVCRLLLEHGASTECRTPDSFTPLHRATLQGNVEMIDMLCRFNADVNAQGPHGMTALHVALQEKSTRAMQRLLYHGASAIAVDGVGCTVLLQACWVGDRDFVDCFLKTLDDIGALETKRAVVNKARPTDDVTPLHVAVELGHLEIVVLLIQHGADKETKNSNGFAPLTTAAGLGHTAITEVLLEHGADIEARCKLGSTPLFIAAETGRLEIAKLLLDHNADINCESADRATPLTIAMQSGHTAVCRLLLKRGAATEHRTPDACTPLHRAAFKGNVTVIDLLCEFKAHVNAQGPHGKTALHMALGCKSTRAVLRLLDHGASASAVDNDERTVLLQACFAGDENVVFHIVQRLDAAGDSESKRDLVNKAGKVDGWAPLHATVDLGRLSLVKLLVEHGADMEAKTITGSAPMHIATLRGDKDVVKLLLEKGANKETTNARGATPLMIASDLGFEAIVNLLLGVNANVLPTNIMGESALFVAALRGREGIVKTLLAHKADPNTRTYAGQTPLLAAAQSGYFKLVMPLVQHGADVDCQAYDHWTPLAIAARNGHVTFCERLLKHCASVNVNMQTADGLTALHRAASCDRRKIIHLLLKHRADPRVRDFEGRTAAVHATMNGHFGAAELLDAPTETTEGKSEDSIWPLHSLLELYGKDKQRQERGTRQDPPWFINRSSVLTVGESASPTTFVSDLRVGSWIGARVLIVEPTIIASFKGLNADKHIQSKRMFRDEVSKLYRLRHPHIIKLYGASHRNDDLFMVMEQPQNGTLRSFVGANKKRTWSILHEVALGVQYLHERGIVHGNLTGDNIVAGDDGLVKLTGFGEYSMSLNDVLNRAWNPPQATDPENPRFSYNLDAESRHLLKDISAKLPSARPIQSDFTSVWEAPEVLNGHIVIPESDVYSLGMCVIEAVSGAPPYAFEESEDLKELVLGAVAPRKPPVFSDREWELVRKMICFEPYKRLRISEVVRELAALSRVERKETLDCNGSRGIGRGEDASALLSGSDICPEEDDHETPQRQVVRRLRDTWKAVDVLPPTDREHVQVWLQDIHARFTNNLEAHSSVGSAAAARFAAERQHADRIFSFHTEIDRLLEQHEHLLGKPTISTAPSHAWRDRWHAHRREQLQSLGASLDRVRELDVETATYLLFELTRRRDAYTSIPPADIHAACCAMRSMRGVRLPDWFIPHYEVAFDEVKSFSRGAFGSVHHGEWISSRVVVKKVFADDGAEFEKEVETWSQLYHPYVLQLFGACHVGQKFLVSEFASRGQLDRYLRSLEKKPVKRTRETWRTLYEAALGLQYLHARGVIHCDLKCNNILIGQDGKAKVSDYGLSRTNQLQSEDADDAVSDVGDSNGPVKSEKKRKPTGVGAPRWKAPEVLRGAEPTVESDVYGFGMCVVEAVTGEYPWGMNDRDELVSDHVRGNKGLFGKPKGFSEPQWALVVGACRFDPKERLPLPEMVAQLQKFAHEASLIEDDAETSEVSGPSEPEPESERTMTESARFSDFVPPNQVDDKKQFHQNRRNTSYSESW